VANDRAESRADTPELAPDTHTRGAPPDLRARLAELPGAHPSAAEYASDRPANGRQHRTDRESPSQAAAADQLLTGDARLTADRRTHILDGDKTGGGHRHGTGLAGKTEFPADWGDDRIIDAVLAVAAKPDEGPERQRRNGRWRVGGEHDGVRIVAIVESDSLVWTAWPRPGSPGVVKNEVASHTDKEET